MSDLKHIPQKNYAARAEAEIRQISASPEYSAESRDFFTSVANRIGSAVHFSVPEDCLFFDNGHKGLRGAHMRLPYPSITLEFDVSGRFVAGWDRALILAWEQERLPEDPVCDGEADKRICALLCGADVGGGEWHPQVPVFMIDCGIVDEQLQIPTHVQLMKEVAQDVYGDDVEGRINDGRAAGRIVVGALFEFIEALQCSNVIEATLPPINPLSIVARQARKAKLPIYETKVLTIEVGSKKSAGSDLGRSHRSPRMHLRRGHARRLSDGRKIWVNSAVVGAGESGSIDKSYIVKL